MKAFFCFYIVFLSGNVGLRTYMVAPRKAREAYERV